jgi:SAM-dependent methyltransferase
MLPHHDFLNPRPLPSKIDSFHARRSILRALTKHLGRFEGTLLDVGCGQMPYKAVVLAPPSRVKRYLGLDSSTDFGAPHRGAFAPPDLEWQGEVIPLEAGSVDCAMATEVLEQCPEPGRILREVLRVLKPGGVFFFTVPFLWPLHNTPFDQYRFTPAALGRLLAQAGFTGIELETLGGWDASLAQMVGLWVRRRPMGRRWRWLLSRLAAPLVRFLADRDRPPPAATDQTMITGLAGIAVKPPASSA